MQTQIHVPEKFLEDWELLSKIPGAQENVEQRARLRGWPQAAKLIRAYFSEPLESSPSCSILDCVKKFAKEWKKDEFTYEEICVFVDTLREKSSSLDAIKRAMRQSGLFVSLGKASKLSGNGGHVSLFGFADRQRIPVDLLKKRIAQFSKEWPKDIFTLKDLVGFVREVAPSAQYHNVKYYAFQSKLFIKVGDTETPTGGKKTVVFGFVGKGS